METRRCGDSDLRVSVVTMGLMVRDCSPGEKFESLRQTILRGFERGITSIDLATFYGRGTLEEAVGRIIRSDLGAHRDRLVIATKAGWADGSRKTLTESLDQSLRQLGLNHVDVYYHHAPDPNTPLEETARTLCDLVRQGKTRHVGVSNYPLEPTLRIVQLLRGLGTPCVLHQCNYNMLNRWVEDGLLTALPAVGASAAVFYVLNQGVLSDETLSGPRPGSRAAKSLDGLVSGIASGEPAYGRYAVGVDLRQQVMTILSKLQPIARERGQTLAQMALAWTLRHESVATALVGMSSPAQADAAADATAKLAFTQNERQRIAEILPPRWGMK